MPLAWALAIQNPFESMHVRILIAMIFFVFGGNQVAANLQGVPGGAKNAGHQIATDIADAFASDFLFNHTTCEPTKWTGTASRSPPDTPRRIKWMTPQEGLGVLQQHPLLSFGDSVTRQLVHSVYLYVSLATEKGLSTEAAFRRFVAVWTDVPKDKQHAPWQNYSIGNQVLLKRAWASTRGGQLQCLNAAMMSGDADLFDTIYMGTSSHNMVEEGSSTFYDYLHSIRGICQAYNTLRESYPATNLIVAGTLPTFRISRDLAIAKGQTKEKLSQFLRGTDALNETRKRLLNQSVAETLQNAAEQVEFRLDRERTVFP